MKNWWQSFFQPITGEVMFNARAPGTNEKEVETVLRHIGNKPNQALRILDLCCGEGRHSIVLARNGHEVVGLDYTASFLKVARKKAKASGLKIKFVEADMKKASASVGREGFDAVFSLFNSFGYFDRRIDDYKVLQEAWKVLKPGGVFVLNTINGDGAKVKLAQPISAGREPLENVFMLDSARLDFKKMQTDAKWTIIDARKPKAKIFRHSFHQNVYTHRELKALLRKAGFRVVKTWGVLEGGEFDEKTSWHQTIYAQKVARG